MRRVLAVAAIALMTPAAACAHVIVAPAFVEDGVVSKIAFETPNERPPHATTKVSVTAPPGISVVSAGAPAGWQATVSGQTVSWSGGRIEERATASFPMRVVAKVRAGSYSFTSAQKYDDGATVRWKVELSVLPATGAAAPKQHPWGAVAAAIVGVIVIAGSIAGLRRLRR